MYKARTPQFHFSLFLVSIVTLATFTCSRACRCSMPPAKAGYVKTAKLPDIECETCKEHGRVVRGGNCGWGTNVVTVNYTGLTPRGKYTKDIIDRAWASCKRKYEQACGVKIRFVNQGGMVQVGWGAGARQEQPCTNDPPAYGTWPGNMDAENADAAFHAAEYTAMHEMGHALWFFGHGGNGVMGGLKDTSHPNIIDAWMKGPLVVHYGRAPKPPPKPLRPGFYIVHSKFIKPGYKPLTFSGVPKLENTQYKKFTKVPPGVYFARPKGEAGHVPVRVAADRDTVWRMKRKGEPAKTRFRDYKEWFGPVQTP